ncbi:MAG: hypothetical protein F4210_11280 [Holophagales bacterium]|nr:hypothetical protein [Holophagales bacterium]MYF96066.1 hypothetical protein [Holophagales bacterium]
MNRRALLAISIVFVFSLAVGAQQQGDAPPPLNIIGLTGLSFGAWIEPDTQMEAWVQVARFVCQAEEFCKINVFDGPELATHVDPVPEENRKALKYVFTYQQGETPPIVVREAQPEEGKEPQEWTFD